MQTLDAHVVSAATDHDRVGSSMPRAAALAEKGATLRVTIDFSPAMKGKFLRSGRGIPGPVSGLALIDTGAARTLIDASAARRMGLSAVARETVSTPFHRRTQRQCYAVQLSLGNGVKIFEGDAIGAKLRRHGLLCLIGRDALQNFVLAYDGRTGCVTVSR